MPKFNVTVYERTLESIDLEVEAENEQEAHSRAIAILAGDEDGEYPDDARDWHGTEDRYTDLLPSNEDILEEMLQRIREQLDAMGIGTDTPVDGAYAVDYLNELKQELDEMFTEEN